MPGLAEIFDFGDQRGGIDHRAGADNGLLFRAQNAAGNQLQHEAVAVEDDGVAGVVSAGVARGVIKRLSQAIDDFAFPFVAPLGADNRNRFRPSSVRQRCRSATTRVAPCPSPADIMKRYRRADAVKPKSNPTLRGGRRQEQRPAYRRRGIANRPSKRSRARGSCGAKHTPVPHREIRE